jgi:hypothetical protein
MVRHVDKIYCKRLVSERKGHAGPCHEFLDKVVSRKCVEGKKEAWAHRQFISSETLAP